MTYLLIVTAVYIGSMAPGAELAIRITDDGLTRQQCEQARKSVPRTLKYMGATISRATCEMER